MLQVLHLDVSKVDWDVACVAMVFQLYVPNVSSAFLDVCCKWAYMDVAYVSHICCKSMFEMFKLFQSYVANKCFHVASVLFGYCICFTHMFQVYISNVSSA